ncbi:kinase [Cylindrobasidium torrendii FP15055 ss-10]|uniref:Kinase n=1 Tax=Cylindrobasidium torrendii FP15055 ss-10 TaxID=1314674 RepID=A0A0D7B6R7_9AGAR|nr:kinase [Cylindrobasidium torrendii FP15055 ss-10]
MSRLYPVREEDEQDGSHYDYPASRFAAYPSPPLLRGRPSPTPVGPRTPSWSSRQDSNYSQFQLLYRAKSSHLEGPEDGAEDEDNEIIRPTALLSDGDFARPTDAESKARLEWQLLFASVLSGDVLKTEKTRIQRVLENAANKENDVRLNIWLGLRAKFHGKSVEEERKTVESARLRFVDDVLKDVITFRVNPNSERNAGEQVNDLLSRLDIAHSLYPSLKHFFRDKPNALEAPFQQRWDVLNLWSTVISQIQEQIRGLKRWTGSETLDVKAPYTNAEKPIATSSGANKVDGSSFVDRVLKEESMQRTFEKGALGSIHDYINLVRNIQLQHMPMFQTMGLPSFEEAILPLISFPTRLALACLQVRTANIRDLDSLTNLRDPKNPKNASSVIVDQMTDDLRLALGLACTLMRQYESYRTSDTLGRWSLPDCLPPDYERAILEALTMFFRLIHMKLRLGSKHLHFKETDVLEAQWPTFIDISMTIAGASAKVAEHLCTLMQRLIVRLVNHFDTQVRRPPTAKTEEAAGKTAEWYTRMLDQSRLRYRKIQRYARMLTQRFTNSAEYNLNPDIVAHVFRHLADRGFILVYTDQFESDGIYVLASPSLCQNEALIARIMTDAYNPSEILNEERLHADEDDVTDQQRDEKEEPSQFVMFLSPSEPFHWTGDIHYVTIPQTKIGLPDNRMRIVADGGLRRLALAKESLATEFARTNDVGQPIDKPLIPMDCTVESKAHLSRVDAPLVKMNEKIQRLAESIVSAVPDVQKATVLTERTKELMQNWYSFGAEHGQYAQRTMERSTPTGFNRLLIELAISWLTFICEDCNPNEQKTFKWAVSALEFTFQCTARSILHLPEQQFIILRQGVAQCMTLLTGHFDILGARSNRSEKEMMEQMAKQRVTAAATDKFFETFSCDSNLGIVDEGTRRFWEHAMVSLQQVDENLQSVGSGFRMVGRVLDIEKLEDRSLVVLANSSSNIAIKWQQGKFIGAGAFGSVYMGLNLDSGSLMAVKEIKCQEVSGMHNLYQQIKDELRVMEMLRHPNIVEYYGIEVHRDKVFIFEEYCENGTLGELLEHGRIEDEEVSQLYTMQLLEGLDYLHAQGVVHRDIKPENILLDHQGILKLADFGAAKIIAKKQHRTTHNVPAMSLEAVGVNNNLTGTPMYMSPEVIKNSKAGRNGAMDIWSLGCVVLEFATGKKPWSHLDNEWAIMYHIGVATQHPPLPDPDQMSDIGVDFIKTCLTIDPSQRPTAHELMQTHPWMVALQKRIQEFESQLDREDSAGDPNYGEGHVAAKARALEENEEREQEEQESLPSSVTDTPNMTPVPDED